MLIDIIAGARPNFMKIAPIIVAINAEKGCLGEVFERVRETLRVGEWVSEGVRE